MITDDNMTISNMGNRIGFVRHAAEYWLLAKIIVDRLFTCNSNQLGSSPAIQSEATSAFITGTDSMLSKYDQTSMQQVNDLISLFQNMQFQ